jgi:type III secretory pathway component EscT
MNASALDPELLAWMTWGSLVWLRVWSTLRVQVLWARIVGGSWWLVSAALAWALTLSLAGQADLSAFAWSGLQTWVVLALREFAIGTLWGVVVALPTHAVLGVATEIRNFFSTPSGGDALVISISSLALLLAIGLGLHHPTLLALSDAMNVIQVGAAELSQWSREPLELVSRLARDLLTLALALSTPLFLSLAVADTVIGGWAKGFAVEARAARAAASWLRASAALLALGASWLSFPQTWARALA